MTFRHGLILTVSSACVLWSCDSTVSPPADSAPALLQIVSGTGQTGSVGTALANSLVVRVTDENKNVVSGVSVAWAVRSGGGSIDSASNLTGSDGTAAVRLMLGTRAGPNIVEASTPGLATVTFNATAVAGPPAHLEIVSGDNQTGVVGAPLRDSLTVLAIDAYGNPAPSATVTWHASTPGGGITPNMVVTDRNGTARARWTLGSVAGVDSARAAHASASVRFMATGRPAVSSISPSPFGSGDTLRLRGLGLSEATVLIDNINARVLESRDTLLTLVIPSELPTCSDPLPLVALSVIANGASTDTVLRSLGTPIQAPTSGGAHAVIGSAIRVGCRLTLSPGTYGIALYVMGQPQDTTLREYVVELLPESPAAAAGVYNIAVGQRPTEGHVPIDVLELSSTAATTCNRTAAQVGDTIRLRDEGLVLPTELNGTSLYRVYYTSPHFTWLIRPTDHASLGSDQRLSLEYSVRNIESTVYEFLRSVFTTLPDFDNDGKLNIVLGNLTGATGYYGGTSRYADGGCVDGDFIWIHKDVEDPAVQLTELAKDTLDLQRWKIYTHEMTHWIDTDVSRSKQPYWSIEGFAVLMGFWNHFNLMGLDFWTANARSFLGDRSNVQGVGSPCIFYDGNYGSPILGQGTYEKGCAITRNLLEQAIGYGISPTEAAARFLRRVSIGDLHPVFEVLTGLDRSEDELQGEILLEQYSDDFVAGTSARITNSSFNLRSAVQLNWHSREYPLPSDRIYGHSTVMVRLSQPDGIVIEVVLEDGAILRISAPTDNVGVALVRAH